MKDTSTNQLPPNQKYIGWKEVNEKEFDELFPPIQKKNREEVLPRGNAL
jgi:hypothetical protein